MLCLASQIQFTEQCEAAIRSNNLQDYIHELEAQMEGYTSTDLQDSGSANDPSLHVLELKLKVRFTSI